MRRAQNNSKLQRLAKLLPDWFSRNARDLPWRSRNAGRDPYAIWVSEIMLQQTQVKTVLPYWERWMRELPTIEAVANASPDKIHKLWEGLGYYSRARNLQKAARQVVEKHDGKFPQNFDDVLALPGIGRYTAGAICSIAFNQPTPILDGNVIRVLTRVFGIGENPREKKTNAQLWRLAEELVGRAVPSPPRRGRDTAPYHSFLNQSLMELGALICTPRQPQCPVCPVKRLCVAFRQNRVGELPNLGKRSAATKRRFMAFVVERQGRFLVRRRPAGVVNAHLWEFPNVEIEARRSEAVPVLSVRTLARREYFGVRWQSAAATPLFDRGQSFQSGVALRFLPQSKRIWLRLCRVVDVAARLFGSRPTSINHLCTVKHSITRYRITLEAWRVSFEGSNSARPKNLKMGRRDHGSRSEYSGWGNKRVAGLGSQILPFEIGIWLTPAKLNSLAFTAAHKKILTHLKHDGRHLR